MNPLQQYTKAVNAGTSQLLVTDYLVSVDTTNGISKIILPSKDAISASLIDNTPSATLGSFVIYDIGQKAHVNPIQILAPNQDALIDGQLFIWLTVPAAKVQISFDGNSYSANVIGNNGVEFVISPQTMSTMTKSNPIMLIKNPDPSQYLKIDYAALIAVNNANIYNGIALKFGYMDTYGNIITINKDISVSKYYSKLQADSFGQDPAISVGDIHETRNEFIANTLLPAKTLGASLVAWFDTPPPVENGLTSRIIVIWKWYRPFYIKILF